MPAPAIGAYVRLPGRDHPGGVYRIVGAADDGVRLLQVGDTGGRRVHTGRVVSVPTGATGDLAPADTPSRRRSPVALLAGALRTGYWSIRAFARELGTHPVATATGSALVILGSVGGAIPSVPDAVAGLAIVVGSLGLAFVGRGRLQG